MLRGFFFLEEEIERASVIGVQDDVSKMADLDRFYGIITRLDILFANAAIF